MKADKLYLVGFMGSGKNTVALVLAKLLGWEMVDLDVLIEAHEGGISANEIIRTKGMVYFRAVEARMLTELRRRRNIVVATGGGAFPEKANRELMLEDGLVFWLYVPLDIIVARLSKPGEIEKRPLMQEPAKKIAARFEERQEAYRKAHEIINGVGTPEEVADDIFRKWKKNL